MREHLGGHESQKEIHSEEYQDGQGHRMIAAAFQYAGLGIILGMMLVTAVVVLAERRDRNLDPRIVDEKIRRCARPTLTDHREVRR